MTGVDAIVTRETIAEIDNVISYLFDAQARQRIVIAWQDGQITPAAAMELLVSLDLLEPVLPPERQPGEDDE